jgi:hypothetical protein
MTVAIKPPKRRNQDEKMHFIFRREDGEMTSDALPHGQCRKLSGQPETMNHGIESMHLPSIPP